MFATLAFLGLFITALLNSNPDQTDEQPRPPQGLVPAVSLYTGSARGPGRADAGRTQATGIRPPPARRRVQEATVCA